MKSSIMFGMSGMFGLYRMFGAGVITILLCSPPPASSALQLSVPDSGATSVATEVGGDRGGHRTVKIFIPDREFLGRVWSTGVDYEGASGKPGGWMEFLVGPEELGALSAGGISFQITDTDPGATLARHLSATPVDVLGFGLGSMGGYYTLAEVVAQLDSMKNLYPSLITGKQPVGYTVDGRTMWGAKISDNPDLDEGDEPEVLYTALIHAREPAGMMTVVYYMWWLLEQYGDDPRATYLVDNRQIWFIPVVNADGYAYNESTNPSGGGLWRKNRRNNGNGTFGVDLNRNFGPDIMWDAPNGGSSTSSGSATYRGINPFSEPETQSLDVFMRLHEIRTCFNYHTQGRLLIYPYGYLSSESEDSLIYREFAHDLVRINRYASGTDQQTVNYSTRGNSDDYMYGDTSKFRTFAMTPEVGSSFWPASELILPLASENLDANIHYSMVAGSMAVLDHRGEPDTTVTPLVSGEPFALRLRVRNKGLEATPPLLISLSTDSFFLDFEAPTVGIPTIPPLGDTTIRVAGMVGSTAASGRSFRLIAEITSTDGYLHRDTLVLYTGDPLPLFSDDAESGTGLWTAGGAWAAVPLPHKGTSSFHDSPSGNSPSGSSTALQTASPINLTGVDAARLRFWTRWEIEPTFDFGRVDISTDGGIIWQSLPAALSNTASGYGAQMAGTHGFDGYTPGLDWIRQEIDLTPFAGAQALIRFQMATDGSDGRDGWYIDDILVEGFRDRIQGSALLISGSLSSSPALFFGEWPGANDGIDSSLGELPLPPPPVPDTFDARWRLPGGEWSFTDIRDTLTPGMSPVIFRLVITGSPGDYPLTIAWNRALLPGGGWKIRDSATSGSLACADMWLTDELRLTDTGISVLDIVHSTGDTAGFALGAGWNLVSLPVYPANPAVEDLFPGASPVAYAFDSEYIPADSMVPGTGYWIRNPQTTFASPVGGPFVSTSVVSPAGGWTLFGALYCPVALADICPGCPAPPLIYGYNSGYFIPDTLHPGRAYWYHGSVDLNFGCSTVPAAMVTFGALDPLDGLDRIRVSDGTAASATLYLASTDIPGGISILDPPAPPPPPGSAFDARFESHRMVEYFTAGNERSEKGVLISNPSGDLVFLYQPAARPGRGYTIRIRGTGDGAAGKLLEPGLPLRVSLPGGGRILLSANQGAPAEFMLHGNYPNPFNPETVLRFDLPENALVSLSVRNITGQAADLPFTNRPMDAGPRSVPYDASGLASGVYFYTLSAVGTTSGRTWNATGKLLLIR